MKAYIFDYGATLDTRGEHWSKVIWRSFQRYGVPVSWDEFWDAYVFAERRLGRGDVITADMPFRETLEIKIRLELEYLVGQKTDKTDAYPSENALQTNCAKKENYIALYHKNIVESLYAETMAVTADSRAVLDGLYKKDIPMVLVSNFYGNIRTVLREFCLDRYFLAVIESAEVGIRKPDSRIWQLGIDVLQREYPSICPADITVVGDSIEKDILPAKSLGCHTLLVTKGLEEDMFR